MIWDLLMVAQDKATKRKNMGIKTFPRKSINEFDGCCFFMTETDSIYQNVHGKLKNSDFRSNSDNYYEDENNSTSIILIESNEQFEE